MKTLYVYYKVEAAQSTLWQSAVLKMQNRLRGDMPGLAASLHQRTDEPGTSDTRTWMETYHFNGYADERAWEELVQRMAHAIQALPPLAHGPRHQEWFSRIYP